MASLGERLRIEREKKGLSQEELGNMINAAKSTISQYELGKRKPDTDILKQFAILFNCTTDYLLGLSDLPRPEYPQNESEADADEEDDFDFVLAANNEDGYGKEPSPELKDFIKNFIKEELDKRKKK